jgi:hypothetical protein
VEMRMKLILRILSPYYLSISYSGQLAKLQAGVAFNNSSGFGLY